MKELTGQELKKICLNILKYIDEICRKNKISYFIGFGTLIGAIRHKGFIPWDDDIDVCMFREDYKKFIKIMEKQNKYQLICPETDDCYYWTFARVSDKSTKLVLKGLPEVNNLGVFVDVFPIDNAPPSSEVNEWLEYYIKIDKKVKRTVPHSRKYKNQNIKTILSRVKNYPFRLIYCEKNFKKYREELIAHITKYNNSESKKCIISSTPYNIKAIFNKKDFLSTIEMEFEGIKVLAPIGYDNILKQLYGDYMKLPPIEKRKTHHNFNAYWK